VLALVWPVLIANLAVVSLFISVWAHARHYLELRSRRLRRTLFAVMMAAGAIVAMSLPLEFRPGIFFDLRGTFVGIAALFGGPVAAVVVTTITAGYRLAMGGAGALPGVTSLVLVATCGLIGYWYGRRWGRSIMLLGVVSAAVGLANVSGLLMLPPEVSGPIFSSLGWVMVIINFAAMLLAGYVLMRSREISMERRLLRAGVAQAPDFFYVKDRAGRFVAVNRQVANYHHFSRPADMNGKTDFDLVEPDRARTLFEAEQRMMETGEPIVAFEEELPDATGQMRCLSTSKSPLRDADGNVIGLAGVTHDVTERRRLEREAARNHQLVNLALAEMSDGLAMFDRDGYLVLCNQQYTDSFPRTRHVRQPGTHIRDILRAVVETGEQLSVPRDNPDAWIDQIAATLTEETREEVSLADGRWLQIRTRPIADGSSIVVVTDTTTIKAAELALLGMTDQLKELATTDGLTGLLNRRSFDQAFANELARTARERQPITLLMIDIDRFKAYNDRYGHQAGDACLKLVANCLRESLMRPGDSLARYGGEEFSAILPNTDEDGAYVIAERFRKNLRALELPHEGSEKGVVTASIGIASYPGALIERSETELLRRADAALYDAKAAGRDRVTGWRGTHDVLPRPIAETVRRSSR